MSGKKKLRRKVAHLEALVDAERARRVHAEGVVGLKQGMSVVFDYDGKQHQLMVGDTFTLTVRDPASGDVAGAFPVKIKSLHHHCTATRPCEPPPAYTGTLEAPNEVRP